MRRKKTRCISNSGDLVECVEQGIREVPREAYAIVHDLQFPHNLFPHRGFRINVNDLANRSVMLPHSNVKQNSDTHLFGHDRPSRNMPHSGDSPSISSPEFANGFQIF